MSKKGNFVSDWNSSYVNLPTTYSTSFDTPSNIVNIVQHEFVLEDIKKYLQPNSDLKILEVGCGGARTSVFLARNGYNTTCMDSSTEAVRLATANFESFGLTPTIIQDDIFNSRLQKDTYDCAMSFGLLEHFEELDPVISSISSFLRPGGIHIHCIIPKKFSTETIINLLMFPLRFMKNILTLKFDRIFVRSFRDFPHYENSYSVSEYCTAFERAGNMVLRREAGGTIFPFYNLPLGLGNLIARTFGRLLYRLTRTIDRSESHLLHKISVTFYIVARKTA